MGEETEIEGIAREIKRDAFGTSGVVLYAGDEQLLVTTAARLIAGARRERDAALARLRSVDEACRREIEDPEWTVADTLHTIRAALKGES